MTIQELYAEIRKLEVKFRNIAKSNPECQHEAGLASAYKHIADLMQQHNIIDNK